MLSHAPKTHLMPGISHRLFFLMSFGEIRRWSGLVKKSWAVFFFLTDVHYSKRMCTSTVGSKLKKNAENDTSKTEDNSALTKKSDNSDLEEITIHSDTRILVLGFYYAIREIQV